MKKFKAIFTLSVLCCLIIALLLGCSRLAKKDSQAASQVNMLEPQPLMKFADIPVPVGFKLLTQDSYIFESAGVRVGLLRYHGKADPDRVLDFYKEQMLLYNWNLLNVIEYGQHLMNFDRENETCIVNLLPKGNTTTIVISLGPKSQGSAKRNKDKTPVK
jgi:hypothetical protein